MNRATTRGASSGSQPSPIVTGRVLRGRDFSLLVQPRALLVIGILLAVAVLLALIGLTQGKVAVPLGDIIPAIFGNGERKHVLALGLRMPRVVAL